MPRLIITAAAQRSVVHLVAQNSGRHSQRKPHALTAMRTDVTLAIHNPMEDTSSANEATAPTS